MSATVIITFISALANIILGLFVYIKNTRSATNRLFLLLAFSIASWLIINQLAFLGFSKDLTLFFARFVMALATVQTASFFLLSHTFPKDKIPFSTRFLTCYVVVIAGIVALTLTPFLFSDVQISGANVTPQPEPGIVAFLIVAVGSVITGATHLVRQYYKSKGKARVQIGYMLLGAAGMFGALILFNLIFVLFFKTSSFTPLGSASTLLFTGAISYAIIRHRFLDIKAIVARSVVYVLLVSILSITYVGTLFGISQLFFRGETSREQALVYTIVALFVAITYQPLKTRLEVVTEKIFYKNQYDSNKLIANVTNTMAETLKLEDLTRQSLEKVTSAMHTSHGSFWIVTEGGFRCMARHNFNQTSTAEFIDTLHMLSQSDHIMVREDDADDGHQKMLKKLNVAVAMPLFAGEGMQGIILLGDKKSGDIFTEKDINVLQILAPGLATALENARSYKQISEFNQTLETEVDKATSELKLANDQLTRNNEKLRQLDKLKDEFISVTSHELRTPLTAIRGYLWMAMNGKNKEKGFEQYMDRAYVSTERLITLVNDTLDISRIESGRMQLATEATDLNRLAQEVVDDLHGRATQQHQSLTVKKTRSLPLAKCDPVKIYQVLTNLVGNALKFTPEGGKIIIDFQRRGDRIHIRVKDTGPGISPEDQAKLFQKFSRLEATASSPGTGLGLYLCQQIIKLSRGKIWIESKAGYGSSFIFTLPVSSKQVASTKEIPRQFKGISH